MGKETQYIATGEFDFSKYSSDDGFGTSGIKTIEEEALQAFLTDTEPVVANPDTKITPITEEKKDTPAQPKEVKDKNDLTEDDLKTYMGDEDEIPSVNEKEEKKTNPKEEKKVEPEDENTFVVLSKDLEKLGIFLPDEEDETPVTDGKSFKEKFIKHMEIGAGNILDQLLSKHGPDYRDWFQSIVIDGVHPDTYMSAIGKIQDIKSLDIKNEYNQEQILKSFYKSKGFAEDKISNKIQKLKDYGDLEDEATEVHKIMVGEEEKSLQEETKRSQENALRIEQNRLNYQQGINKIISDKVKSKTIDGIPVTPSIANKVYQSLVADAYQLNDGRRITEFDKMIIELDKPENFEKKVKLAFLLQNGLDLSKVQKEAVKAETNAIFEGLEKRVKRKEIDTQPKTPSFFNT